jgi:hypothetical protein
VPVDLTQKLSSSAKPFVHHANGEVEEPDLSLSKEPAVAPAVVFAVASAFAFLSSNPGLIK